MEPIKPTQLSTAASYPLFTVGCDGTVFSPDTTTGWRRASAILSKLAAKLSSESVWVLFRFALDGGLVLEIPDVETGLAGGTNLAGRGDDEVEVPGLGTGTELKVGTKLKVEAGGS